jgi:hypothetical protein
MDHVSLDRPRPDDGHLDHQVIEPGRLEPGQHGHLSPALDLEHAHRVRPGQHPVDLRVLGRQVGDVLDGPPLDPALGGVQHVEAALQRGQHAQRQHIDLHQAQSVDVVLVPFDEGAVLHGPVADGHGLVQPVLGQDEAAYVLGQVAWELEQLVGQGHRAADLQVLGIEARLEHVFVGQVVAPAAPDGVGERGGDVLRQPHGLAHVADGAARAVVDHGGADGRLLPPIAAVDVLHHLLAPLVLEIDVDVGRLVPVGRQKALEQHLVVGRVHRRDPQAEADGAVGRRAPALAKDARLLPREADEVVHGEKVFGQAPLLDEAELLAERAADRRGIPWG